MAISYKNINGEAVNVNNVTFNGQAVKQLRYGRFADGVDTVWCKPYTLTVACGTGVAQIKVTRVGSEEPTALFEELHDGDTVYYGDKLAFEAQAQDGFELNPIPEHTARGDVDTAAIITARPKQFFMNISHDNGIAAVTVTRESSQYQHVRVGELPIDAPVYFGDEITINAVPNTGFNTDQYTAHYLVCGNITTEITGSPKSYTLSCIKGAGVDSITAIRTSSYKKNVSVPSALTDGDTIYYGDVIAVTAAPKTGYVIDEGQKTYTVSDNLRLNVTALVNQYRIIENKTIGVGDVEWTRTESQLQHATTGTITANDVIYHGDKLHASVAAETGFDLQQYTADYTVSCDVTASFAATVKTYGLTVVKNTGIDSIRVVRTANKKLQENNSYELYNGGRVKHFDEITVTATAAANYVAPATYGLTVTGETPISPVADPNSYVLSINRDYGVLLAAVQRKTSLKQDASIGSLQNGDTIYYGDTLSVIAHARTGYELNLYTTSYTVTGNVNVNLTTRALKPLNAPRVSGSMSHDSYSNAFYVTLYITNPNNLTVTADILVEDCNSSEEIRNTITLSPNENRTYNVGEMYTTKIKATVTLRSSGYTTMSSSEIIQGSFNSSSGSSGGSGSTSSGQS